VNTTWCERLVMEIRLAAPGDFSGVLQLQAEYFIGNLAAEARKGGFVSAEFTTQQLEDIAKDVALLVAVEQHHVVGYLCAASCEYYRRFPLLAALMRRFPDVTYSGRRLDAYRSFIYGPVCIDRSQRGRGLLVALYEELLRVVRSTYEIGVALISNANRPSYEAHVRKLGMTAIGEYEFEGHQYGILAFTVPTRSR